MVRHLNPAGHNQRRITKAKKDFVKRLDFKDIKFPAKIRDVHKIEKKNSIAISVFDNEIKRRYPIYVPEKCCKEKHVDLVLIAQRKKHCVLINDFNRLMYDHSLHRWRKHFRVYYTFITEEILKVQIKDFCKINDKQIINSIKHGGRGASFLPVAKLNLIISEQLKNLRYEPETLWFFLTFTRDYFAEKNIDKNIKLSRGNIFLYRG